MTTDEQAALDHAWRHFALHAGQRISVFNFYVASSGLLLSGLVYVLATDKAPWPLGVAAGLGAAALSLVFWKLDQRSAELVNAGETVIEAIEASALPPGSRVFTAISVLPVNTWPPSPRSGWSFGRSFRVLFAAVAVLGLAGAATSAFRWERTRRPPPRQIKAKAITQVADADPSLRARADALPAVGHSGSVDAEHDLRLYTPGARAASRGRP